MVVQKTQGLQSAVWATRALNSFRKETRKEATKRQLEEVKCHSSCMRIRKTRQNFGNLGETVRDLKNRAARKKRLSGQKEGTLETETRPLMPREVAESAHSLPAFPAWLKT